MHEAHMKPGQFVASDLVIDFDAGTVRKNGEDLVLPDLTWRTLCCLAGRQGAIVSIDELIDAVWGGKTVSNETVTQRIKLLRQALGDNGKKPQYIETIRSRGFRFIPALTEKTTGRPWDPKRGKTVGALVAIAVVLGLMFWPQPPATETELDRIVARGNEYLSRLQHDDNQIAVSLFKEALRRDGDNSDALIGLSFASSHNASKFNMPISWAKEGETLARMALELDAGARAHHALGFALDAQGQIDAAIGQYEKALALYPDNAAVLSSVAYLYQVGGQLAKALDFGLRAHKLNPDIAFSEVQIAATLRLLERNAEANDWLERGVTLKPDNVFIYSLKTEFQMSNGEFSAAMETISDAVANGIKRPELYIKKGLIAAHEGRKNDAAEAFAEADALEPERQAGRPYKVWLDLLAGAQDARPEAEQIIAGFEGSQLPQDLIVAAGLEAGLGNNDAAHALINGAIDLGFRGRRLLAYHPMFTGFRDAGQLTTHEQAIQNLIERERLQAASLQQLD